jgi:hypothetical protein
MTTPDRNNHVIRAEHARRHPFKAIVYRTLQASRGAGDAFTENQQALCRDLRHVIATYLRDRSSPGRSAYVERKRRGEAAKARPAAPECRQGGAEPRTHEPAPRVSDAATTLASALDQVLRALAGDDGMPADIRLTVHRRRDRDDPARETAVLPGPAASARAGEMVPMLRWLVSEATGKIANIAHQLETRAAEIGDGARAQLHDDLTVLDEELAVVNALLDVPIDWDAENRRLLAGEIPPLESDADDEDDE